MNHDLRQFFRHALAGAQIERHPGPAPVGHASLQRNECFGFALRIGTILLKIAGHTFPVDRTGDVLATYHIPVELPLLERLQRLDHLDLLVANGIGIQVGRRIHGDQTDQLEQMILHHIAQLAGMIEVAPAAFNANLFGNGNFHMRDMVLVPLGPE